MIIAQAKADAKKRAEENRKTQVAQDKRALEEVKVAAEITSEEDKSELEADKPREEQSPQGRKFTPVPDQNQRSEETRRETKTRFQPRQRSGKLTVSRH